MSNDTAKTITTNIVPVQGTFEPLPPYECINLIGPAGTPFFAPVNPNLDGVSITNSTINSTTIGATTPSTAAFTTATMTNQPVGNLDLCNKTYVDAAIVGISWKQPVRAATTANITLSGNQTIDTVAVTAGDRVLVKDQTAQAENGIYIVGTPWTRSPDADTWDELVSAMVFVESGGLAGAAFYCPIQPGGTLGVTAITWSNFSVAGTYFAGTGLSLAANTFSITNTGVSAATYGSASAVPTIAVNAQGQITSATATPIAIAATAITSGTIDSARLSGSYSGITGVGTLTDLTVSNTITGSISGNAATATTATTATSATTATNLAGGATGSVPYQSGAGATTFLGIGSTGQVLTVAGGVPSWATPSAGTVTSVSGTGTVSGISLSGTVTSSGSLTLGGTLDLSAPPTIGNATPNTIAGTTVTASTSFGSPVFKATSSAGGTLQNASGAPQMQWGSGGGNNLSLEVATNINPANAAVSISPTGTGTVAISPAGALTINPTTASTMNNVAIGGSTPAAAKVTTLNITSTLALNGSTGTAGYVLTSNGASAPTWEANANGITIADDTTTNATRYITFSNLTTGTETTLDVSSTKLTFNPSTGALGAPAAVFTTINGNTFTTGTGTLTIAAGKTLTANNSITFAGTDATTMTFPSSSATVAGLGIAQTFTALQTFSGSTSVAAIKTSNIKEVATVSATAATGTINYNITTQSVLYYTSNASANWTVNFRGSSGTSLNTLMSTGETMTAVFMVTQGSTAYYNSAVQIDGNAVTPKWLGGSAPTAGNVSGIDVYTYAIVKTGSATFTVFASVVDFA